MPRAKVENVVGTQDGLETVEVTVKERENVKTARFSRPTEELENKWFNVSSNPAEGPAFMTLLFGPKEDGEYPKESPNAILRRLIVSAIDKKARADVYESLTAESTIITVGKDKVDILEQFKIGKIVQAVNGYRDQVDLRASVLAPDMDEDSPEYEAAVKSAEKSVGYGPWRTAGKRLVEAKLAVENDEGKLVLAEGVDPKGKFQKAA